MEELNKLIDMLAAKYPAVASQLKYVEQDDEEAKVSIIKMAVSQEDILENIVSIHFQGLKADLISSKFGFSAKDLNIAIARRINCEYVDLDTMEIDYKLAEKVQSNILRELRVLPYKEDEIKVYVAFANPRDFDAQDRMQNIFNRQLLEISYVDGNQLDKYIKKMELRESIKDIVSEIKKDLSGDVMAAPGQESFGILKLIQKILETSITQRASDIHIEPTESNCIVRSRIDGILTETFMFESEIYPPMVSRMKLLSNMDIAEKRKPQDGRFTAQVNGREYDFRISTLPIINGESIVLRILDKSKVLISLDNLGMHPTNLQRFQAAMHAPYGIILVTGPTGSGKTTTLYAALNDMKSIETKIITVEDPVEYQLGMIQQVHVNEKAEMTFAAALRSILRQDPDIIMIGEIRDAETLRIAIQAALTGHLVFSTLHTNDAVSAVARIIDMGIESYMISGALTAIEAQRLVRKLCPKCKEPTILPDELMKKISKYLEGDYQFYKHVGCVNCAHTGYTGREMISEILPISDKISSLIANNAGKDEIRKVAYEEGFVDMFHDGVVRASRGITTMDEIFRVAKE